MSSFQRAQHEAWRVILVGRTGLDQILRRDASIELIRARDAVDALGELSDPIDPSSPARAAVLVSVAAEPTSDEIAGFVDGLRLIDSDVRVLRVGSLKGSLVDSYDGSVNPNASLAEIVASIQDAQPQGETVGLRFVDVPQESSTPVTEEPIVDEPVVEPVVETEVVEEDIAQEECVVEEAVPEPDPEPKVVVVVRNEDFEHRAAQSFEEESTIHKQVLLGIDEEREALGQSNKQGLSSTTGPQDDQVLVEAMLAGRSILDSAVAQINARLDRDDITFIVETDAAGMPVLVGSQMAGKLVCADQAWAMGDGHALIAQQGQWLSMWIKLEIQQTELRKAAFTDSLTGAWNRRYFTRYLDAAIVQARGARQPLSVMLFDIDDFKHYNDAYGHAAGDEILVETVKLLKSVIRPSDRVCRVGGDEFAVIFYEPSGPRDPKSKPLESVYQIATRFQKQICTHRFPKLAGEAMGTLAVSAGLASFPWDGHDSDSLLERADQLAIESKANGKNAITLGVGAESVCKTKDD